MPTGSTHCCSATVTIAGDTGSVACLHKRQHCHSGVNGLFAGEKLAAYARVGDGLLFQNHSRYREGLFGVVGGLTDSPFVALSPVARMISPGIPSNPWTPPGYQVRTATNGNFSVCFATASPVAKALRQAPARSSTLWTELTTPGSHLGVTIIRCSGLT